MQIHSLEPLQKKIEFLLPKENLIISIIKENQVKSLLVSKQIHYCNSFYELQAADSSNTYLERMSARLHVSVWPEIYAEATYSGETPYNKILVMRFDRPIMAETHTV